MHLNSIRDISKMSKEQMLGMNFGTVMKIKEELGIESNAEDFDLVGDIAVGDSKVYIVKYKKEVNWRDFELFEGAGVGYFTKQEMLKINITENTKSIIEKYLGR